MKLAASVSVIAICALTSIAARADDSDKQNRYVMTPLTSDLPDTAPNQDPVLQNAWGVAFTPGGSPFWIADNATGCSTLYDGTGVPAGGPPPLKVKIPLPSGQPSATSCMTVPPNANPAPTNAAPTGMVWNPTSTFVVPGQQTPAGAPIPAAFIWATEDGTISAWAGLVIVFIRQFLFCIGDKEITVDVLDAKRGKTGRNLGVSKGAGDLCAVRCLE